MNYIVKFFHKQNGALYGPARDFKYEIGELYTVNRQPRVCDSGYHFPIFKRGIEYWGSEYLRISRFNPNISLVACLCEVSGRCDFDHSPSDCAHKMASENIKIVKEFDFNFMNRKGRSRDIIREFIKYLDINYKDDIKLQLDKKYLHEIIKANCL